MNGEEGNQNLGTVEQQAQRMGWVPQEEFKGDPDRWVPADKFIERAETVLPIAKGTIKELQRQLADQEAAFKRELAEIKASTGKFVEFARKAEERAYNKALEDLKAKQRAAAEESNPDAVEEIGKQIEEHIKTHPAVTGVAPEDTGVVKPGAPASPEASAWIQPGVFEEWKEENPWFDTKPRMSAYAEQVDKFLMRTKPNLTQRQRLNEITVMVKEEFPEYWTNPRREGAPSVEGGVDTGTKPPEGKRSYANLVPEAKAICDEFSGKDGKGTSGTITGFTREEYLAQCDPSLFIK